ncbi:FAD dependent oxidoreductase-domain-containing protein [Chytridium lagenaria]|nr:FAD dependent oxidoreductase-domain-containing protein [Chytridium lagenaria]
MTDIEDLKSSSSSCTNCPRKNAGATCTSSESACKTAASPISTLSSSDTTIVASKNAFHVAAKHLPGTVYDVVIIGAGVVGCSIARELSKYNLKTIVLEKADDVAAGASKANSGIVHGGYDERHGTLKSRVAHKGNSMFKKLNEELNFGFRVTGSLVLAFSQDEIPLLHKLLDNGIKNGVQHLRILNREEIIAKEPHINKNVVAALFCPHTGITSPYEYTIALAENAITNGVEFQLRHEVTDIQRLSIDLLSPDGRYIVRAGLDEIASMVGAADFRILPRKGEYVILDKSQGKLAKHVLFPVPNETKGKGILVSQTFHGNLLLGPTSRDTSESSRTNLQVLEDILISARQSVPDFDVHRAITSYAGLRAKCDRKDFIIEESNRAPAAGLSLPTNPRFNPYRAPIIIPKTDSYEGLVDHPSGDPKLNIICRCETVSEAEIIDAVHRPLGAHSTDAVKKRTRAGMGWCQGNFCEPRVAAVVARELGMPVEKVPRRGVGTSLLPHQRLTEEDRDLLDELSHPKGIKAKL